MIIFENTNCFSKKQLKIGNSGFVKTCDEYVLGLRVELGLGWPVVWTLFGGFGFRLGVEWGLE